MNIYIFFFFFFFFFLYAYNFPIFKIWKRKTVWAVLIFDGFCTSRFFLSLLLRVSYLLPELAEISIFFQCWICLNWRFRWNFSNTCWPFLAQRFCRPIIRLFLFHHLAESRLVIDLNFCRLNRLKCKRVQLAYPFFPLPLQRSFCYLNFLNACWVK